MYDTISRAENTFCVHKNDLVRAEIELRIFPRVPARFSLRLRALVYGENKLARGSDIEHFPGEIRYPLVKTSLNERAIVTRPKISNGCVEK